MLNGWNYFFHYSQFGKDVEEMFISLEPDYTSYSNPLNILYQQYSAIRPISRRKYGGFNIHFSALREADGLLRNAVITQYAFIQLPSIPEGTS